MHLKAPPWALFVVTILKKAYNVLKLTLLLTVCVGLLGGCGEQATVDKHPVKDTSAVAVFDQIEFENVLSARYVYLHNEFTELTSQDFETNRTQLWQLYNMTCNPIDDHVNKLTYKPCQPFLYQINEGKENVWPMPYFNEIAVLRKKLLEYMASHGEKQALDLLAITVKERITASGTVIDAEAQTNQVMAPPAHVTEWEKSHENILYAPPEPSTVPPIDASAPAVDASAPVAASAKPAATDTTTAPTSNIIGYFVPNPAMAKNIQRFILRNDWKSAYLWYLRCGNTCDSNTLSLDTFKNMNPSEKQAVEEIFTITH